jgi:WD40 repeat protein
LPHLRLDRTGRHGAVALSADGRWILTGGDHGDPERTAPAEPVRAEPSAVGTAPAPSLRDRLRAATEAALARWAAQLWDADTGRRLHLLPGHKEEVTAVAIAPDGRLLFTGDRNGRCALWDRESGRELRRFWDDGQVNAAAFLPDGKRLLTASTHAVVRQWSVDTGDEVPALTLRHPDGVVGLALSRDGTRLLTSCADGRVRVWDPTRAVEVITLNARGGRTAFIQNLRRLLGDVGARGAEWNESRLAQATQLPEARVAELLAGTGEALSQELDGLARVFAVSPDALWKTTFTVAIAADGATGLTVAADDRIVRLWNLADGREIRFPATDQQLGPFLDFNGPVHRGLVWAAGFSPAGDRVVTVGGDSARLWDARLNIAAQQRELMSFSPHTTVAAAEFSPDGKLLVTGSWDNSVRIWDAQSGQALHKLGTALGQPQEEHRGKVNSATFAPDGGLVLTASDDATAKLWSTRDWSLVRTLRGHTGGVLHAAFARDGRRIVTASRDETARLWDVKSGQELAVLSGHRGLVMQAVFSDDGNWLATGSADHSAQIWELDGTTATPVHTLKGHTASVTAVAFSPDASRVLTGSEDYTVKLWDAHAGREILTLSGHTQGVTSVAFSPSGHEALTASRDGTAILWLTQDQRQP